MKPDARGWVAIALFLTFILVFVLRALVPDLLKDQTTNNVLVGLMTAGPSAIAGFYFGSMHKETPDQ